MLCTAIANYLRQLAPHAREREAARLLVEALKAIAERDEALRYLMQQFDREVWNCPRCGHAEDTATTDSAYFLRNWLEVHNAALTGAAKGDWVKERALVPRPVEGTVIRIFGENHE